MKPITIKLSKGLRGTVVVPGDKSISHRAAILAALARGKTRINNFLFSDDCFITLNALSALGVKMRVNKNKKEVFISSDGCLRPSKPPLWMGGSGTSARILLGVLAAQPFATKLTAAHSLLKRPMARVIVPLRLMGANIHAKRNGRDEFLPLEVFPSDLKAINWSQVVSSAQVKSAILLAGLYAKGKTCVNERIISRDHTERMLKLFNADLTMGGKSVCVKKGILRTPGLVNIPGDISSAAFFIVAALLVKNSKIVIKNIGINPTRIGAISVLKRMGARIRLLNKKNFFEPQADIEVFSGDLRATVINVNEIPGLVDELPILMVAASLASGTTIIRGVKELRVKETDRISSMTRNLLKLGVNIRVRAVNKNEIIEITGVRSLRPSNLQSFSDHRTAMSMFVASLAAKDECGLDDVACINKSFPGFLSVFKQLMY
ncbi:MAG: 3-phosphoshikimate 1-carboxyvinyltransferase [Candidatus Omnitrophica bacterium CG_4_10_14_0_2_um_filter_44_9]|nr:MAG: 3-phosphoshikimate 1-carboxyvinyltransferase [Candidatus Omnitrophica bacterium CG_4_10_14_0_8_um_filter_44_12]PIZ84391.1 MAG: 3-phosphoshikimate 1-carboxyvinyltransferase [Candidatus Omnitrophica bacterium CG_4_10_14_0_2_um_filter_44_9]